jgi:hypothetical protein
MAAIIKNMMNSIRLLIFLVRTFGFSGPPGSGAPDLEVVSLETNDPSKTLKEFATSNHTWTVKFREYAKKAYGIDFAGPPPSLNEMIIDWHEEE